MNNGGIARRLVNFSKLFVGWIPGSLAQANIVGNMLFGALSGSSVAAASAMGGCIYPIQKDEGYDPAFATAVNIASAPTGLLIPPTSAFIVYSTVAGRCIHFNLIYGWLHSWYPYGCWFHGSCHFIYSKKA